MPQLDRRPSSPSKIWRHVLANLFVVMCLLSTAAPAAAQSCRVDGDAPKCAGKCDNNEIEVGRTSGGALITGKQFRALGMPPPTGSKCFLGGSKAICCPRCPQGLVWRQENGNKWDVVCVTPAVRDGTPPASPAPPGKVTTTAPVRPLGKVCIVNGVPRRDILSTDCEEAQRTGCIRRLLSAQQYARCLAAQPGAAAAGTPKKARAVAANTVYKQPNGQDTPANTVCAMSPGDTGTVASTGPDKWVRLTGISGACGGKSGWLWNAGELQLP